MNYHIKCFSDNDQQKTKTAMEVLFGTILDPEKSTNTNNVIQSVELINEQIDRYKKASVSINQDPLAWWSKNQELFSTIAPIARDRLSVAGTSVPSERLFSAAGNLLNAKRACLSSENVDMLLFLNKNLD